MPESEASALAMSCGADCSAPLLPADIPICEDFALACEQNRCGSYGKNWACPPGAAKVMPDIPGSFSNALAFQVTAAREDPFDYASIEHGAARFDAVCECLRKRAKGALVLGTGPCKSCSACTYPEPCRAPERRTYNMEAAAIDVSALCKVCGLSYLSASGDIYFTGLLLW